MALNAAQDWHNLTCEELTLRLGPRFRDLCAWACDQGLQESLEVAYIVLGLGDNNLGVGNLAKELSTPESRDILRVWDDNPAVPILQDFITSFKCLDEGTQNRFRQWQGDTAEQTKTKTGEITHRTFLLAMLVHPIPASLGDEDATIRFRRQRLRLWLVFQAVQRIVENTPGKQCLADKNISAVARFLTKDASSVDDMGDWAFIDAILARADHLLAGYAATFERYTRTLSRAVGEISPNKHEKRYQAKTNFADALRKVALGETAKIERPGHIPFSGRLFLTFHPRTPTPPSVVEEDDDAQTKFKYTPLVAERDENLDDQADCDEDAPDAVTLEFESGLTVEEQELSTGSYFLQTAEQANYLPWSWDRPLPHEFIQLDNWIASSLTSQDMQLRLGAAITWIASNFGRSLFFTLKIGITDGEWGDDWTLNQALTHIGRRSPRRHNSWTPESEAVTRQVAPFAEEIVFELPDTLTKALQTAARSLPAIPASLADLWHSSATAKESIETWFNAQAKTQFPRLKSGMLAQAASQRIYNNTADDHLARMLTSYPQSGLPGACGYSAWNIQAIEKGLPLPLVGTREQSSTVHILGSVLVPLEALLVEEIARVKPLIEQSDDHDFVTFHNRFVMYCVIALYAATGCRHLKVPFESLQHFNLDYRLVFINDKADGGLHNGRIVPLPDEAVRLLRQYLMYLSYCASQLEAVNPELARKIHAHLKNEDGELPLFFLLDEALNWHVMTDEDMPGLPLFDWLLPSNLFRHRYAQKLSVLGLPVEIIDGWMGHQERGIATYGDFSPRNWTADRDQYQSAINHLFDSLSLGVSLPSNLPHLQDQPGRINRGSKGPDVFGLRLRKKQRLKRIKQAYTEGRYDIALFLDDRELNDLDTSEIERLVSKMLVRSNGMPHNNARIRLQALIKALDFEGSVNRNAVNRRVAVHQLELSLVHEHLPVAVARVAELNNWAVRAKKTYIKAKLSKQSARCLGAVLVCIEKRLSHKQLLLDIVKARNTRIVQNEKRYFLEWSEELESKDSTIPVQRHEISYKTASLLVHGIKIKTKAKQPGEETIPDCLTSLPKIVGIQNGPADSTVYDVINNLAGVYEQANLVQLPGLVAGALSERYPPTSLPLQDYLRIVEQRKVEMPDWPISSRGFSAAPIQLRSRGVAEVSDTGILQVNANNFYREIYSQLKSYKKANAKATAKAIKGICEAYGDKVSSAVLLLGYWVVHVISRGQGRGKQFKPYARRSLIRYFDALKLTFSGFAYHVDLLSCAEFGVTELYQKMVEHIRRRRPKNIQYFGDRLKQFHRWASRAGVEDPDWSELDVEGGGRSVNPGLLSEEDYLLCHRYIKDSMKSDPEYAQMLGFVLLLTYRFGLRAEEAIFLRRADWCEYDKHQWVLVRNNRHRELKWSSSSRRAVPLLFEITDEEKLLIEKVLARYESIAGNKLNFPILCESWGDSIGMARNSTEIPRRLIHALRKTTGNPFIVLHHCRHSFCCRLGPVLLGITGPVANELTSGLDSDAIREVVLGPQHDVGRRSGMALARLMGHRMPNTALKNYIHLMPEWADMLTSVSSTRSHDIDVLLRTQDLKTVDEPYELSDKDEAELADPTLSGILKALRLVALGKDYHRAAELLELPEYCVDTLERVVHDANNRMRFKIIVDGGQEWIQGSDYPLGLLKRINGYAWVRMIGHADAIRDPSTDGSHEIEDPREISMMIGKNRHLLMRNSHHCWLVRQTLSAFNIPEGQYSVVAVNDGNLLQQLLTQYNFRVSPVESGSTTGNVAKLDPLPVVINDRDYFGRSYGGLIIKRSPTGVVRNSFELAVCFLAMAVLLYCRQER